MKMNHGSRLITRVATMWRDELGTICTHVDDISKRKPAVALNPWPGSPCYQCVLSKPT